MWCYGYICSEKLFFSEWIEIDVDGFKQVFFLKNLNVLFIHIYPVSLF